jgi:hypothetical protein
VLQNINNSKGRLGLIFEVRHWCDLIGWKQRFFNGYGWETEHLKPIKFEGIWSTAEIISYTYLTNFSLVVYILNDLYVLSGAKILWLMCCLMYCTAKLKMKWLYWVCAFSMRQ